MNCPKCGAELYRGDRYCEECGASVREYARVPPSPRGRYAGKHSAVLVRLPNADRLPRIELPCYSNRQALVCLSCVLLWFLQIVYTYVKSMQISILGFISREYTSFSLNSFWAYADAEIVALVIVAICAVSLVLSLLPVLMNRKGALTLFIFPKISAVLCALFWLVTVALAADAGSLTYGVAKPHFTIWLWLYLIHCVALLVLSFVASGMSIRERRLLRAKK